MRFDLQIPTRIHFGRGILAEAIRKESTVIQGNVLIVSSNSSKKNGMLETVSESIKHLDQVKNIIAFTAITSNPKINEVNQAIDLAIQNKVDVIIGLGGGSALDAAKAVAAGAGAEEHIDRFFFNGVQPDERTLPIIAIPTTAGTGSELSKSGILSCPEQKKKGGVRGEALYPKAAIVDPELTYSVPFHTTMETGFDVLSHAVESYISKAANPFTQALSEQAITLGSKSLKKLAVNLEDVASREAMSYASMIMGINLGNASTALPHRMQYPVGALTDSGHGKGLMALYPAWITLTYQYSPEKFNRIGTLISGSACSCLKDTANAFASFMDSTCGRISLKDFGLQASESGYLASLVDGNLALDPAGDVNHIIENIYKGSF